MKAIRFYLDEALDLGLAKNDSDIARHLNVSRATVSDWRVGRTAPNEDQAAKLSALLGKPEIMAECMAHRAKIPEARAMWERAAHTLSMTAGLCAVVGVSLMAAPSPANASAGADYANSICIMLSWRRTVRQIKATIRALFRPSMGLQTA